jgi:hypothetical protein
MIMNLGVNVTKNLTMHSIQTMKTVNKKFGIEVNGRINITQVLLNKIKAWYSGKKKRHVLDQQ